MAEHNDFGKIGEEKAYRFLLKKKYKVRARNWQYKKSELDIVAEKNDKLIVIEVKTRSSEFFESPKEAVTLKKQRQIILGANAYIEEFNIDMECQFDVVSVVILDGKVDIEHIQDAFMPLL